MAKREYEAAIFRAFLKIKPDFCGEKISEWKQPTDEKDFPDVICTTESRRKVGVEIGEWLNEQQLTQAKGMERAQEALLKAIGPQGDNKTDNIYFIWQHQRPRARVRPDDVEKLREELQKLISETDKQWPSKEDWHSPQGHLCSGDDLRLYPTLSRYLTSLTFFPRDWYEGWPPSGKWVKRTWPEGNDWKIFPARGGPYSENTMLQPLQELLAEKIAHYSAAGTGFDKLNLLVPYNQAWIYNSPAETPDFKFVDAQKAREFLEGDFGPFRRIFLFVATGEGEGIEL